MTGQLITLGNRQGFAEAARRIKAQAADRKAGAEDLFLRAQRATDRLLLWGKVGWCVATLLAIALVLVWLVLVPAAH